MDLTEARRVHAQVKANFSVNLEFSDGRIQVEISKLEGIMKEIRISTETFPLGGMSTELLMISTLAGSQRQR